MTYPLADTTRYIVLAGCLWIAGGSAFAANEAGQPSEDNASKISALVDALGNPSYEQRESAQKKLIEIGEPAEPALREAMNSNDLEIRQRAKTILNEITARIGDPRTREIRKNRLWSCPLSIGFNEPAVAADGIAAVIDVSGGLYGVSLADGTKLWQQAGFLPGLAASGQTLYVRSKDGLLQALDIHTGQASKEFTPMKAASPAVVADGTLYVAIDGSALAACDAKTGQVKWKSEDFNPSASSPRIAGGTLCFIVTPQPTQTPAIEGEVVGLDIQTGTTMWRHKTQNQPASGLVAGTDKIYFWQGQDIIALDAAKGTVVWTKAMAEPNNTEAQVVVQANGGPGFGGIGPGFGADQLFITSETLLATTIDGLAAVDTRTGNPLWTYDGPGDGEDDRSPAKNRKASKGDTNVSIRVDVNTGNAPVVLINGRLITPGADWSATMDKGVLYVTKKNSVYAVNPKTRQTLWILRDSAAASIKTTVIGDMLLVAPSARPNPAVGPDTVNLPTPAQQSASLTAYRLKIPATAPAGPASPSNGS